MGALHVDGADAGHKDLFVESNQTPEGAEDGLFAKGTSSFTNAARQPWHKVASCRAALL